MLISFIIPVYNTANYLDRCLSSIINQSFADYEVIIVNDGSTDNSIDIAKKFTLIDSRFSLVNQENSGQGSARNKGIELAKGDWIWFVDSDDWITNECLARLSSTIKKNNPDVLVINYYMQYDSGSVSYNSSLESKHAGYLRSPYESEVFFASISCWSAPPWRLICRRKLLNDFDIRFATGLFYEDHPFAIKLMLNAELVYVDPTLSYAYYQREGSTVNVNDSKAFDFIKIRRQVLDLLYQVNKKGFFNSIIAGYIAPYDFFKGHVADEYKEKFINYLNNDTSIEEVEFASEYCHPRYQIFLEAIKHNDLSKLNKSDKLFYRIINLAREKRYNYLLKRLKDKFKHNVLSNIIKLKNKAKRIYILDNPSAFYYNDNQFISIGNDTTLESYHIDVRVNKENRAYLIVGDNSLISGSYIFERGVGKISIGNYSSIGGGSLLICSQENGIKIGNHVMLSWNVTVIDTNAHSLNPEIRKMDAYAWKAGFDTGNLGIYKDWDNVDSKPIIIEDDVWIGFGASIMKGVTIGRGAIVAANSVVTKNVAPFNIVAGNPAKFVDLAPREKYSWEDIIEAYQGVPNSNEMLRNSFLDGNPIEAFERYHKGLEFKELKKYLPEVVNSESSRILDVGCGIGVTATSIATLGVHVDAIEPSNSYYTGRKGLQNIIDELVKHVPLSISIYDKKLRDNDLLPGYDAIVCRQVFHHFENPIEDLKFLYYLVKPGGRVIFLREHVVENSDEKQIFLDSHPFHKYYGGENAYTEDEYCRFSLDAGFRIEKILKFKDSVINYWPHSLEEIASEKIIGSPYSFILKRD